MLRPAQRPSSSAPTNITPGRPWPGRSLAKAQMLLLIFSAAEFDSDRLRSTRSDSRSAIMAASSSSLYPSGGMPAEYRWRGRVPGASPLPPRHLPSDGGDRGGAVAVRGYHAASQPALGGGVHQTGVLHDEHGGACGDRQRVPQDDERPDVQVHVPAGGVCPKVQDGHTIQAILCHP